MKEHIERVLQEINDRISELLITRRGVKSLLESGQARTPEDGEFVVTDGFGAPATVVTYDHPKPAPLPEPKRNGRPPGRKTGMPLPEPKPKVERPARAGSTLVRMAVAVRVLKEPFGSSDVQEFTKCNWKAASNWITAAHNKGWLKRVGPGQYTRTPSFGGIGLANQELLNEIHAEIESAKPKED